MRNILFILVDCLRVDTVSGDDRGTVTPTIDKLMAAGTFFNQAISTTTTTTPCVASLLTGAYPFSHGIRTLSGYKLKNDYMTLPQVLGKHGYHTYASVTWPLSPLTRLNRGFDDYEYHERKTHLSDEWGADLRRRFNDGRLREPWFYFLHLMEVHRPRKVAKGFDERRFGADLYERAVSSLDAELGRLLQLVGKDTIIILHGDHGENREVMCRTHRSRFHRLKRLLGCAADPRFYRAGHGFHVYDFLIRVPLLFTGADIFPKGKVISDQVRQIDIFPTLLEALGIGIPATVHGRSLMPLIRDEPLPKVSAHVAAVGEYFQNPKDWRVGIRTPDWKYVCAVRNPSIPAELYDLRSDPDERRNLVKKHRTVANQLRQQLLETVDGTHYVTDATGTEEMTPEEKKAMDGRLADVGGV